MTDEYVEKVGIEMKSALSILLKPIFVILIL